MKEQKFKFVLVGSGNISKTYYSAINNIPDAELVSIISRSGKIPNFIEPDKTIEIKDSLNLVKEYFDAVIICTPNALHCNGVKEAAKFGKHILSEKPLGINLDEINEMIDTCKKMNVKLGVAYQRRVSGDNQLIKKLCQENSLGNIFAVTLSVKYYRDDIYYSNYRGTFSMDGGGAFMQQASHYIDLYAWLFGKPKKIISALDTFTHKIEVEDYGSVICLHENNLIGTIIASTSTKPGFNARMEIHSDKGTVILENDKIIFWSIDGLECPIQNSIINQHSGASNHFVNDTTSHEIIIKDFIKSVRENKEPLINGESAKIATEFILEIYKNKIN